MNELPHGWFLTNLGEVADWGSGGTPSRKNPQYFGGDIPWVKTGELGEKYVLKTEEFLSELGLANSSAKIFPTGSVGIAMYGATIGKLSIWGLDASTNQACAVAQTTQGLLENKFLYFFLLSEKDALVREGKGGAQPNISQGLLRDWSIALPPLNEQRRIVEKIENLFAELDKGEESLEAAKARAGLYRQSLLKHAFEGHLTADWRAANPDKLQDPETLLTRIQDERDARYKQALDDWQVALAKWRDEGEEGKKPKKPKRPNKISSAQNLSGEVPSTWVVDALGNLAFESILGKMLDKEKNRGAERPYLGNINVRWGKFDVTALKVMRFEGDELARYSLKSGDLVVCEGGEPGRCAVWRGEDNKMYIQKALHRVRFTDSVRPDLVQLYFAHIAQTGALNKFFTGTTIKHLTGTNLAEIPLPLCTLVEQTKLVQILDSKLSVLDAFEDQIQRQLIRSKALRQSILKRAFAGELVDQDPNDEPASELLERIKAEKVEAELAAKRDRKTKPVRKPKNRRPTMTDLIEVLKKEGDWVSASKAALGLGIADGTSSDDVEAFYRQLKERIEAKEIEVERRGDEDWLRLAKVEAT